MESNATHALFEQPFAVSSNVKPQVLYGLPFEEYAAIPAVNSGLLREMDRSPAHGLAYLRNGIARTESLELGQHIHTRLLEPERFAEWYVVMPDFATGLCDDKGKEYASPRATNKYKAMVDEFVRANPGKNIIDQDAWNICEGIAARVAEHASASQFIGGRVKTEVTVVWRDEATQLPCKARLDVVNLDYSCIVDFKSTEDARPHRFIQSLEKYGYHLQAGHYIAGALAAGLGAEHYAFVPVEKKDPFGVTMLELDPEALEYGKAEVARLLKLTKECIESNVWPCYDQEVGKATFSEWKWKQIKSR